MGMIYERDNRRDESDSQKWNRAVGPFYFHATLSKKLGVDEQELQVKAIRGQILALRTSEGQVVYPARQFFINEDGVFMVNPAISPALRFLMEHEEDFGDVRHIVTKKRHSLISEWTIAAALLQQDDKGGTLLDALHQNLDNPSDESWSRLLTLNGMVSGLRKVLKADETDEADI